MCTNKSVTIVTLALPMAEHGFNSSPISPEQVGTVPKVSGHKEGK